jgi:BlaI family transcriptional regulator, penicillinase repressor
MPQSGERRWTPGGDLERAVLAALWARGEATARHLHEVIGEPRGLVYTTVARVLDRLVEKRIVARKRQGRAFVYRPLAQQHQTQRAMARTFLRQLVGDDPQPAVAALLGAMEDVSPELLDQLAAELAARKGER